RNENDWVEVLQDASSTAMYGTDDSNVVVLITNKRGQKGESTFSYDGYISISQMARKQDLLNSDEYLRIEELAYENAEKFDPVGWENGIYTDPLEKRKKYKVGNDQGNPELFDQDMNQLYDVDWQDAVTRTAVSQNHNLYYNGGTENTKYGLLMGYSDDYGVIIISYLYIDNI